MPSRRRYYYRTLRNYGSYRRYGTRRRRGGLGGAVAGLLILGLAPVWSEFLTAEVWGVTILGLLVIGVIVWRRRQRDEGGSDRGKQTPETDRSLRLSPAQVGQEGENEVRYALRWIGDRHKVIHGVVLKGPGYDAQQFDHLVVGSFGVLNLETKNFSGVLHIDAHGTWLQQTAPQRSPQRISSPVFQVQRHRRVLQAILPGCIPIHDLIVIANHGTIIEGRENCSVPVVTSDLLLSTVDELDKNQVLTEVQIEDTYQQVMKHVVEWRQSAVRETAVSSLPGD